jgi:hypothetical protein
MICDGEEREVIVPIGLRTPSTSYQNVILVHVEDSSAIGQGRTVLFVSHNMASAIQPLCKKRVLLENGMKESYRKAA